MSFTRPEDIEAESFRIIAEEMKEKGISIPGDEAPVTMRVIHTTADFDYSATLAFSKGAAEKLSRLLTLFQPRASTQPSRKLFVSSIIRSRSKVMV